MQDTNWVAVTVALLGAGGIGAAFREIVSVITKVREGVSAKESSRKADLVTQRDEALEREERERERADEEARIRRLTEEYASQLRRDIIEAGSVPAPWPEIRRRAPEAEEAPGQS